MGYFSVLWVTLSNYFLSKKTFNKYQILWNDWQFTMHLKLLNIPAEFTFNSVLCSFFKNLFLKPAISENMN